MEKDLQASPGYRLRVEGQPGEEAVFSLAGHIRLESLSALQREFQARLDEAAPRSITVDLGAVDYLDSAGALILLELQAETQAKAIACTFRNPSDEARRLMSLIPWDDLSTPLLPHGEEEGGLLEQIGDTSLNLFQDFGQVITFLGELILDLIYCLFHPRSVRWGDVLFYIKRAGVEGLPIVGLISLLLGLIIAFMSSLQLKQFGATIYVASLMAIGMIRELAPIMTAILVAGRSGSAFASEIGTMKINEEVDALTIMGFDPVRFLAIPKVLACVIVVPLLTLYADFFGLLGGLLVGVLGLDLTVFSYLVETQRNISLSDLVISLIKAAVFAILIAGIGCQRGFQVRGGAQAVGAATTSAVVAGIFLIIVTDSAFALIQQYLPW